jgi:hypothetical protein
LTKKLDAQSLSLTNGGGLYKEEVVGLENAPGMAMKRHPGLCTLVESCALRYMLNEHTPAFAEALEPFRCAAPYPMRAQCSERTNAQGQMLEH